MATAGMNTSHKYKKHKNMLKASSISVKKVVTHLGNISIYYTFIHSHFYISANIPQFRMVQYFSLKCLHMYGKSNIQYLCGAKG